MRIELFLIPKIALFEAFLLIFKPFAPKFESWDYLMLALIFIVVGIARLIILDANIGYFECAECHERFIASVKDYTFGLHTLKKRKLTCPKCGKKRLGVLKELIKI